MDRSDAERIAALRQALEQIRAHAYAMTTHQIEATAAAALRVDEPKPYAWYEGRVDEETVRDVVRLKKAGKL